MTGEKIKIFWENENIFKFKGKTTINFLNNEMDKYWAKEVFNLLKG